jgi:SAM-dependent methyltransferase
VTGLARPLQAETDEPCDICFADDSMRSHLDVGLIGGLNATVCRCENCGFRQIRPRLTPDELERLYPGAYFDSHSGVGFSDYARQQQRNEREAFFLVKRLERIAPTGRLLEVGCAVGFLLEAVKRFSSWQVLGIDVSPFAVQFARQQYGLAVECTTLEAAGFPDRSFDFIVQKSLLEHVLNPREHLRETLRILKPGGQLWLITPNGEANLRPFRALGARLRASRRPELPLIDEGHLQFFSRENLLRLFSDCGFECLWLRSIGLRRGLRDLGYLPRRRHRFKTTPMAGGSGGRWPTPVRDGGRDPEAERARLCAQLAAEVEARHTWIRSSRPYYYFRRALRGFDGLPGRVSLGSDFSCLLRRPL